MSTPQRTNSPRPMGFVSPISDTNVKTPDHEKSHNPLHQAAQYLKNAVTLESTEDEKRRESIISNHKHINDHGGREAEKEFWEKHQKGGQHGAVHHTDHAHDGERYVEATSQPIGHVTNPKDGKGGGPVTGTMY